MLSRSATPAPKVTPRGRPTLLDLSARFVSVMPQRQERSVSTPRDSKNRCPVLVQTQASAPSGSSATPALPTQRTCRAGDPGTSEKSATSSVTAAPTATIAHAPIVTGAT